MDTVVIFTLGFAPGLFWLWYFYRKDKVEPEPKKLVMKMFFLGMFVAVPISLLEAPFLKSQFLLAVIAAPIIEELGKFIVVRRYIYNNPAFNEPMDGIVYAAATALGFASLENAAYLLDVYSRSLQGEHVTQMSVFSATMSLFVLRATLSVPAHVLNSALWGYALGKAKFLPASVGTKLVLYGVCLACLCHGLFNLTFAIYPIAALGGLIVVFVLWRVLLHRIKDDEESSPFAQPIAASPTLVLGSTPESEKKVP